MIMKSIKNRVVESMTNLRYGPYTVRVWCALEDDDHALDFDNTRIYKVIEDLNGAQLSKVAVAKYFAEIKGVEAVEVTDTHSGNGILIYPDWK